MLTLEQIRTTLTEDEALSDILEVLEASGFQLGAWQTGSVRASILRALAKFSVACQALADALSRVVFNSESSGTGLTHYSHENWGNDRLEAVATIGYVRFTGGAVGPPHTVAAGDVVVSDGTYTFRNTAGFTIPASSYIDALMQAEQPGASGNVALDTITTMVTTYAGVTCNNPTYGATGTWITTLGEDQESDESLQTRNSSSVGVLSALETLDDRYEYIARTALSNCRVKVDSSNPRGPGTVDVYIATATGEASAGDVTTVDDAIQASAFGDLIETDAATGVDIEPEGTVYYTGNLSDAQSAVSTSLSAYLATLPIGGLDLTPGPSNIVPQDGVTRAIVDAAGVQSFAYTAGEETLGAFDVAVLGSTAGLTWVQIT